MLAGRPDDIMLGRYVPVYRGSPVVEQQREPHWPWRTAGSTGFLGMIKVLADRTQIAGA